MGRKGKINKQIFLDVLPKCTKWVNKGSIDWKNSIGYTVHFIYDDIEGDIKIIKYIKNKHASLLIEYDNSKYEIKCEYLKDCRLGYILGKITKDFRIDIGQVIKDDKRDMTIINRKYKLNKNNQRLRYYNYICNKCNFNGWIEEHKLICDCNGCSACHGLSVNYKNCLINSNPNIKKYLINEEDGYNVTYGSERKIACKCPICGFEKRIRVASLNSMGFNCPICNDNISYPEKVMLNLLNELKENKQLNDFTYQYTKSNASWCKKYRYDFYFEKDGKEYIIETHGIQHYEKSFNNGCLDRTLKKEQENDKNKKELAISNGIKEENYIVIDCRYSKLEFIKNNIINSILNEIFDLSKIDWIKIGEQSCKSLVKKVCDYWYLHKNINNENISTSNLKKIFPVKDWALLSYLKKGTELGWCNYDPKKEIKSNSKKIKIFKNNILLKEFDCISDLEKQSEELYGVKLRRETIYKKTKNNQEYKGFTFEYV